MKKHKCHECNDSGFVTVYNVYNMDKTKQEPCTYCNVNINLTSGTKKIHLN